MHDERLTRTSPSQEQRMKFCKFAVLAVIALTMPAQAQAQHPWPGSLEAYLGYVNGGSDNSAAYRGSTLGFLMGALIGAALHPPDRGGPVIALDATLHGVNIVQTADCIMLPDGGCQPWFPGFGYVGLLGGWEDATTRLRGLAGPAYAGGDRNGAAALVGRVDLAPLRVARFSPMASLSALIVPSWNGDTFYYIGIGVGLRLR
jgi:hypothetical protein